MRMRLIKNHYLHVRMPITILEYAINRIRILFMYNVFYIYIYIQHNTTRSTFIYKFVTFRQVMFFML
jgi:hypothetical protein